MVLLRPDVVNVTIRGLTDNHTGTNGGPRVSELRKVCARSVATRSKKDFVLKCVPCEKVARRVRPELEVPGG